jgi:predicted phosphoribosyltransferase
VPRFGDRVEAGRALARELQSYAGNPDVLVLGLPRGGVPVAAEVARALGAPLDAVVVRKVGVPGHSELAMGAVASGAVAVLMHDTVAALGISRPAVERAVAAERAEVARREAAYRTGRPPLDVRGRVVIVVDDGLATGATMTAAVRTLRAQQPRRIVVAVPVASGEAVQALRREADACVALLVPDDFRAVGVWYQEFPQTTDAEVRAALAQAASHATPGTTHHPTE